MRSAILLSEMKEKRFWAGEIIEPMVRNILVLYMEEIRLKNKKYIKVIGIDQLSKRLIEIVDTNGQEFRLLSYNESNMKIGINTIIKAEFKFIKHFFAISQIRIVSDFKIMENMDFKGFVKKYSNTLRDTKKYHFCKNFEEIISELGSSEIDWVIARFKTTEIKTHNNSPQITMSSIKDKKKFFVNIPKGILSKNYENKYYAGHALLLIEGKKITAKSLFGIIETSEEYKIRKKQNEIRHKNGEFIDFWEDDNMEVFNNSYLLDEELEQNPEFFYDEEKDEYFEYDEITSDWTEDEDYHGDNEDIEWDEYEGGYL